MSSRSQNYWTSGVSRARNWGRCLFMSTKKSVTFTENLGMSCCTYTGNQENTVSRISRTCTAFRSDRKKWSRISGPPQNSVSTEITIPEFLELAVSFVVTKTHFPDFLERALSFLMIQNTVSSISRTSTAIIRCFGHSKTCVVQIFWNRCFASHKNSSYLK
jgi:hypothetical protein